MDDMTTTTYRREATMETTTPSIDITQSPATEAGSLDGFQVACDCGLTWTTAFRSMAVQEAADHSVWHRKVGR